jgi:hypothetical protein
MIKQKRTGAKAVGIKVDPMAREIINRVRDQMDDAGFANPNTSDVIKELDRDATLGKQLCNLLLDFAGETGQNEGAVDTLRRLIEDNKKLRLMR